MAKRERSDDDDNNGGESWWSKAKRLFTDDDDLLQTLILLEDPPAETESDDDFLFFFSDEISGARVRFSDDPYRSSPTEVFQTKASSYVTINGNEETCGSSFSDWDSSVMASVDFSFGGGAWNSRAGEFDGDSFDASLETFLEEVLSSENDLELSFS